MPPLLITGTLITVCVIIRLPLDSNADSWMKLESFTLKNDTLHTITVTVSSCYQQSVTDALLSETSLRIRRKFNSDFQKRRPFVSSSTLKVFLWNSSLWIPNAIYMRESLREDLCKVQKSWVKILSFHIDFSLCPHNESNFKSKRSYVFLFSYAKCGTVSVISSDSVFCKYSLKSSSSLKLSPGSCESQAVIRRRAHH